MIVEHALNAENLVILCCHAVYKAHDYRDPFSESSWTLLPYQGGDPPWYRAHMDAAVARVASDPVALLVISGGQTRVGPGPVSESGSYWRVLEHLGWFGQPAARQRTTLEEFARDSFENVLLSLSRFREVVGRYPERVEIVSWGFKETRFALHMSALRWPVDRYQFIGIGFPDSKSVAEDGERKVLDAFQVDPYGVGPLLTSKREERNPFRRQHPYRTSCPELKELFEYRSSELFDGALPWANARRSSL
jgi:hypothetical protein